MSDETSQAVTPFYLDKALWIAVLAPICGFLAAKFGLNLSATEMVAVVLPLVAYILGHKWKSAQIVVSEIEAKSAAAVASQPAPVDAASALKDAAK